MGDWQIIRPRDNKHRWAKHFEVAYKKACVMMDGGAEMVINDDKKTILICHHDNQKTYYVHDRDFKGDEVCIPVQTRCSRCNTILEEF